MLPTFARRMYSDGYRKIFFDDSDIVDKFASAIWTGDTCFYVNFYQITAQGRFGRAQIARLAAVAPGVDCCRGTALPARRGSGCRSRLSG